MTLTAASMLTPGRVRKTGPVLHPRLCAVITAGSCLAHLWLAVENHHGAWLNLLMLALAAFCVPCSVHIWRHSRVSALRQVMAAALIMVAVHVVLLVGAGSDGHDHATGRASKVVVTSGTGALLAVIALEITTALLAATLVARLRGSNRLRPRTQWSASLAARTHKGQTAP